MTYPFLPKIPAFLLIPAILRILVLVTFFGSSLSAQIYHTAETSFAIKLGRTKPLYESVSISETDKEKLKVLKDNKPKVIPNFGGRRQLDAHNPFALPMGPDPLFNTWIDRMPPTEILPVINIEGIGESSSGATPPDVNGDIGKDFYTEIVNATFFRVFDKTGTPVSGLISANSIWSQVSQTSSGDPILLYDQQVDRWLLTEFPSSTRVLVAISLTSDPRGSWDAYAFQTPRFPDFPKYGIWPNAYFLTTNESGGNMPVYAINREDILAGADIARIQRLTVPKIGGVSFEVGQPIDWDGLQAPSDGSPGLIVKLNDDDWGTTTTDQVLLNKIHIDWDNESNSNIEVITIPTTPYDTDGCQQENTGGFSCIPQPNGQGIDGAEWIICNKAQYRNFGTHESFVMCFMVDVTGDDVAGIRWMEFRKTLTDDWHIYQEGTVGSDDGLHRFMPSIGIDGRGNIGLAYSISGFSKFPSLRYTGRYASDPLGTMSFLEYEFATGGGSQGSDRYGDYASMSVDPADDATFWFTGEYLPANNEWSTRIVAFTAHRDSIDVLPLTLIRPVNDGVLGEQLVTFNLLNRGLATVFDFAVGYQFNNGSWISEFPMVDSLAVDSSITYSFLSPVTFDAPGNYPLQIATLLDNDGNNKNDTLSFIVVKFAHLDAAFEYIIPSAAGDVCADESISSMLIRNNGLDTITTLVMQVTRNDFPVDTISWTGSILFHEEVEFSFPISVLDDGDNVIALSILELNGGVDEIPANNEINWILTAKPEGLPLTLFFTTDNFPQESSWKLFDMDNNIIATAGPFASQQTVYSTAFCLDPGECYTFTVFDAFGDGMSAQGVKGDYEIYNESGELIADLAKPNFGNQSSSAFCLTNECLFDLQVGVEHESSPGTGDAIAIGEPVNSLGVVQYSIDGGVNFQSSNSFINLVPGFYMMVAQDGAGCVDSVPFEILSCNLQVSVTTKPAVGGDVGEIHIDASGGNGPLFYSIQGGAFVSDSLFVMLEPGDYIVTVKDSAGCEITDSVTVSTTVRTSIITDDYFINISPNPGKGVFQVSAVFDLPLLFVYYDITTSTGSPVYNGSIVRYSNTYKGEISLAAYPAGTYYIVFHIGQKMAIRRIVKVD
jgi:hypothetical protein